MDVLDRVKQGGRPPGAPSRPFQFTLRTMFIVTTVVAVLCSLLIACPPVVRVISAFLFLLIYSVAFVTVAIYGRGYTRTFAIGGVLALASMTAVGDLFQSTDSLLTSRISNLPLVDPTGIGPRGLALLVHDDFVPAVVAAVAVFASTLAGLTAVLTRWIVERKQQAADRNYRPSPSPAAPEPVVGNPSPPEGSHANE